MMAVGQSSNEMVHTMLTFEMEGSEWSHNFRGMLCDRQKQQVLKRRDRETASGLYRVLGNWGLNQ